MNSEEQQHYAYLAATRLSEIGYRRYLKFAAKAFQTKPANEVRKLLKDCIDSIEAREFKLSLMIRCAPLMNPLQ